MTTATTRYASSTNNLSTPLRNGIDLTMAISESDAAAAAAQDDSTRRPENILRNLARSQHLRSQHLSPAMFNDRPIYVVHERRSRTELRTTHTIGLDCRVC